MNINWQTLTKEEINILLSIGIKKPKKVRKKPTKKFTNLKDKGVPVKVQRNISCYCCKTTTTEYITSYVSKKLQSKDREAITDSVRTCKKCRSTLGKMSKQELIDKIILAYRTFTYN